MGGGSDAPMPYHPANEAGADASMYGTLNSQLTKDQAAYDTASQGYNTAYQNTVNNPYTAAAQEGVNTSAVTAWNQGATDLANASTLNSYAPALINSGFDPLSQNYNYGLREAQDSSKVAGAQAGIAGSPFAAGMASDAGTNFSMNWEAQKAQKQQQALAALAGLFTSSSAIGVQGAGQETAAAAAPAAYYNETQQQNLAALNALVQGLGSASTPIANDVTGFAKYLGLGQTSTQIADQATQINNANSGGLLGAIGGILGSFVGGDGFAGLIKSGA